MNLHLFTIGKPKLAFALAGVEEYARRLRGMGAVGSMRVSVTLECLKAGKGASASPDAIREAQSALLLQRSEGMLRVALDERGAEVTSRELAEKITEWESGRVTGGAAGRAASGVAGRVAGRAMDGTASGVAGRMAGGVKNVAFLIGGADGHSPGLRRAADWTWSLSRLTLQHELALLLLYEQLYRAFSIKAGLPYHRD